MRNARQIRCQARGMSKGNAMKIRKVILVRKKNVKPVFEPPKRLELPSQNKQDGQNQPESRPSMLA
jgi:hypothetical protein